EYYAAETKRPRPSLCFRLRHRKSLQLRTAVGILACSNARETPASSPANRRGIANISDESQAGCAPSSSPRTTTTELRSLMGHSELSSSPGCQRLCRWVRLPETSVVSAQESERQGVLAQPHQPETAATTLAPGLFDFMFLRSNR